MRIAHGWKESEATKPPLPPEEPVAPPDGAPLPSLAELAWKPSVDPDGEALRMAQQTVRKLVAFRRAHEDNYIADYATIATFEEARHPWNINALFPLDALIPFAQHKKPITSRGIP